VARDTREVIFGYEAADVDLVLIETVAAVMVDSFLVTRSPAQVTNCRA
jgi:hypothetical protein